MSTEHKIVAVVAIGKNREIGLGDQLLWHIPDDLKRFKSLTVGHPILFGRKTFESIIKMRGKPLPERTNIVVSRDPDYEKSIKERAFNDVHVVGAIDEAIWVAKRQPGANEIHIGGGAQMYEQALPYLDKLCLTLIDDTKQADIFFPPYEHIFKKKTFIEDHEWNGLKYKWVNLER